MAVETPVPSTTGLPKAMRGSITTAVLVKSAEGGGEKIKFLWHSLVVADDVIKRIHQDRTHGQLPVFETTTSFTIFVQKQVNTIGKKFFRQQWAWFDKRA